MMQESDRKAADIQVFHPDELQFANRLQEVGLHGLNVPGFFSYRVAFMLLELLSGGSASFWYIFKRILAH